jgi:hypothetical protein
MAKLYQLADDPAYTKEALWWLVVSDDGKVELSPPFETRKEAEAALACFDWIKHNVVYELAAY